MATRDMNVRVDSARRRRMRYTNDQLKKLEDSFVQNHYPDTRTQEQLAADFEVGVERIHIWFQNRRSKFKRESKTDHVTWMRKQIFDTEGGKGSLFPFGTPRLPSLTTSCHVLSPPGSQQYGRRDAEWENSSANFEIQHLPSIDFNEVLDLRTCVSPESRLASTPKHSQPSSHHSHIPAFSKDYRYHSNTFSDISFSPCRYSSPAPASTLPTMLKNFLPPAYTQVLPRKMSPVGFHDNRAGFCSNSASSSPSNSSGIHGSMTNISYSSCQFSRFSSFSSTVCQSPVSTNEQPPLLPYGQESITTMNKQLSSASESGACKRKHAADFSDDHDSHEGGTKRMKLSIQLELNMDTVQDSDNDNREPDAEQHNSSGSSLHVDLEQWC